MFLKIDPGGVVEEWGRYDQNKLYEIIKESIKTLYF